eukprot:gene11332-12517_t
MTSTTTSIAQQSNTPSLHILSSSGEAETIQSTSVTSGKENSTNVRKTSFEKVNTNFSGVHTANLVNPLAVNDVENIKIERQAGRSFTDPSNFQYGCVSSTDHQQRSSDSTELNIANNQNNQVRVMTVHSNDQVTNLNATSFAMSTATATQVTQVLSSNDVVNVDNGTQVPASVTMESNAEGTKYTYYPAVQTADTSAGSAGQFYVMMSPQDMIPQVSGSNPQRIIAPRGHSIASMGESATFTVETETAIPVEFRKVETGGRSSRDERRRATHNEVERRRRDKINTWIMKLATIVPDCQEDQSKQGQSKGGILSKTLDYIGKLRTTNERLADTLKDHERVVVENQVLRQQTEDLRRENALLRANLHMHQQDHTDINVEAQQMDSGH